MAGSLTTLSSGGSFSCLFLDGPADPQLSITVTDDDLATGSTTLDVAVSNVKPFYTAPELGSLHNQDAGEGAVQAFNLGAFTDAGTIDQDVANVAPSVDAGGDTSLAEGDTLSRSGSFSDPGADTWTATVDYGDGTPVGALTLNPDKSFSLSHTYADDGSYSVTVTVADDDASGSASFSVTVANVAPSVDLSGDPNVAEGSPYTLSISAVSDPGTDTVSSYLVAWGDGNSDTVSAADLATAGGQLAHTYADGPADHTISVTLTDEDGDFANATTLPVHVTNVAPTVSLNGAAAVDESDTPYAYSFLVSDPGDDGFTVSEADISCGTGGSLVAGSLTTLSSGGSFSCLFLDGPADSQLSITVTDDDLPHRQHHPRRGSQQRQALLHRSGARQPAQPGRRARVPCRPSTWAPSPTPAPSTRTGTIDVDWGDGSTPESFTQALSRAPST